MGLKKWLRSNEYIFLLQRPELTAPYGDLHSSSILLLWHLMPSLVSEGTRDAIGAHKCMQAKHLYNIKIIKNLKWAKKLIEIIIIAKKNPKVKILSN